MTFRMGSFLTPRLRKLVTVAVIAQSMQNRRLADHMLNFPS